MPVAMIMITVSIFEIIKSSVEYGLSYWSHRRRSDEFFGDKASSVGNKALIILEPTNVPSFSKFISPGISQKWSCPNRITFSKCVTESTDGIPKARRRSAKFRTAGLPRRRYALCLLNGAWFHPRKPDNSQRLLQPLAEYISVRIG